MKTLKAPTPSVSIAPKSPPPLIPMVEGLTPMLRKMWGLLSDGKAHTYVELGRFLWDEMSDPIPNIRVAMATLRKSIIPQGYDVVGRNIQGCACYTIVKYLTPQT